MVGQGNKGFFRSSKAGNTRERKTAKSTKSDVKKAEHRAKSRKAVPHVGTSSLVSLDEATKLDDAQERRRQIRREEAAEAAVKAAPKAPSPAAAALLASLRGELKASGEANA